MEEARIEISTKEYQGLKDKIQSLEKELVKLSNENDEKDIKIEAFEDSIDYLFNGISFLERIFQWSSIKEAIKREININVF